MNHTIKKKILAPIAYLSAMAISFPTLADEAGVAMPGFWHRGWEWGGGHMLFGGFFMILFWAGLVLLIFLAARWFADNPSGNEAAREEKTALEILAERFARGEIDKQEYEDRKKTLAD